MAANPSAGWFNDPTGRYANRYWDGAQWTNSVSGGGSNNIDALSSGEVYGPPGPGTAAVGVPITPPPAVHVSATPAPSSSGNIVGIVLSVVAVLFLAVILIVLINNDDSGDDSTPIPTTEAPDTTAPDEGG